MSSLVKLSVVMLLAATIGGCFTITNLLTSTDNYRVVRGIAYGSHARQQLDVYVPAAFKSSMTPLPVVVFYYGGGWFSGNRSDYAFMGQAFSEHEFIVVIPDYRLYPEARFPDFVKDGADAFRWVSRHIAAYGGDPRNISIVGHSAGANIGGLLHFDEHYLGDAVRPVRFVGIAGYYDIQPGDSNFMRKLLVTPDNYPKARPENFVDGTEAPTLLLHGEQDSVVPVGNSRQLAQAVWQKGGCVIEHYYADIGHLSSMAALAEPFRGWADILERVISFLQLPSQGRLQPCHSP